MGVVLDQVLKVQHAPYDAQQAIVMLLQCPIYASVFLNRHAMENPCRVCDKEQRCITVIRHLGCPLHLYIHKPLTLLFLPKSARIYVFGPALIFTCSP